MRVCDWFLMKESKIYEHYQLFILFNKLHKRLLELISVIKCFHIYKTVLRPNEVSNYTSLNTSKFI